MNAFQKQVSRRVLGIHGAIIFLVAVVPFMRGCFTPKPKEIITFIEFGPPMESVAVEAVSQMSNPEPPPPEPVPEQIPEPVKPTPVKPRPERIKPQPEKPKPEKPKPDKPKPTYTRPKDIKIGKRVNETPQKPALTEQQIRKSLDGVTSSKTSSNPDSYTAYIAMIGTYFDRRWNHPASASPSSPAVVRIYITKTGSITRRKKVQGSGDTAFDQSVMSVANSVNSVPRPPAGFPYDYVEVEFRIRN